MIQFVDLLHPVSLVERYSLTVPVDPLEAISRIYSLHELQPYDETPQTTKEALAYIKRLLSSSGRTRTERVLYEDTLALQRLVERDDPILTRKARSQAKTWPPSKLKEQSQPPECLKTVLKSQGIGVVTVEPVDEPSISLDDVLQVKFQISSAELPTVRSLLQRATVPAASTYKNQFLDTHELAKCSEPSLSLSLPPLSRPNWPQASLDIDPDVPFVPIFSRPRAKASHQRVTSNTSSPGSVAKKGSERILKPWSTRPDAKETTSTTLTGFKDLTDPSKANLVPLPTNELGVSSSGVALKLGAEDLEGDISMQNLVIVDVDGWQAIRSSPPTTPSSSEEEEDQLDELCLVSSTPPTEHTLALDIEATKMDEVLIPRSRRVGGAQGVGKHLLHGKTLGSFLAPLIPPIANSKSSAKEEDEREAEAERRRQCSPVPSSMFGQPPSVASPSNLHPLPPPLDEDAELFFDFDSTKQMDYKAELDRLCTVEGGVLDAEAILGLKTIDDGKRRIKGMILEVMDVPDLPQPPDFPRNDDVFRPKRLGEYVLPPSSNSKSKSKTEDMKAIQGVAQTKSAVEKPKTHQFLKKVKGIQALALALSWVPFTSPTPLPSTLVITQTESFWDPEDYKVDQGNALDVCVARRVTELLERLVGVGDDANLIRGVGQNGVGVDGQGDRNGDIAALRGMMSDLSLAPRTVAPGARDGGGLGIVFSRSERRRKAELEGRGEEYVKDADEVEMKMQDHEENSQKSNEAGRPVREDHARREDGSESLDSTSEQSSKRRKVDGSSSTIRQVVPAPSNGGEHTHQHADQHAGADEDTLFAFRPDFDTRVDFTSKTLGVDPDIIGEYRDEVEGNFDWTPFLSSSLSLSPLSPQKRTAFDEPVDYSVDPLLDDYTDGHLRLSHMTKDRQEADDLNRLTSKTVNTALQTFGEELDAIPWQGFALADSNLTDSDDRRFRYYRNGSEGDGGRAEEEANDDNPGTESFEPLDFATQSYSAPPYLQLQRESHGQVLPFVASQAALRIDAGAGSDAAANVVDAFFNYPEDSQDENQVSSLGYVRESRLDGQGHDDWNYPSDAQGCGPRMETRPDNTLVSFDALPVEGTTSGPLFTRDDVVSENTHVPEIATHPLGILAFAQLRAKKVSSGPAAPSPIPVNQTDGTFSSMDKPAAQLVEDVTSSQQNPVSNRISTRGPPPDLVDKNTIMLNLVEELPASERPIHRYLASLAFIQKRGLVRALCSPECLVELVERQSLSVDPELNPSNSSPVGVDLILDPSTAVLFVNLFALPSMCEKEVERIAKESWAFRRMLVVFEGYTEGCSKRVGGGARTKTRQEVGPLNAYTPPIVKAVKKLRRDVSIAEACGTKSANMIVEFGFADSLTEAARLARWYGDAAEREDANITQGAVWGDREWLLLDSVEDEERNLVTLQGMNHFIASIILCQVSLQTLVNMSPEERMEKFAGIVDPDCIMRCNADLEARFAAAAALKSSGLSTDTDIELADASYYNN